MHPCLLIPAVVTALFALLATEYRLLPEVVDPTIILNAAGLGALFATLVGALLRLDPDRLGRLTLLGTVVGALGGIILFLIGLLNDVL